MSAFSHNLSRGFSQLVKFSWEAEMWTWSICTKKDNFFVVDWLLLLININILFTLLINSSVFYRIECVKCSITGEDKCTTADTIHRRQISRVAIRAIKDRSFTPRSDRKDSGKTLNVLRVVPPTNSHKYRAKYDWARAINRDFIPQLPDSWHDRNCVTLN